MNSEAPIIRLDEADNIAVAIRDIAVGSEVVPGLKARADIPVGHKVAMAAIGRGEAVLRFAQVIGEALEPIAPGDWVHVHNLGFKAGLARHEAGLGAAFELQPPARTTFQGIRRASGKVATRNFIGVIASVNCSTTVCRAIADAANQRLLARFPNIDGFVPIVHGSGCGLAVNGEGQALLRRTITGYCRHPNFGGVLLVGLGCEVNQIALYAAGGPSEVMRSFDIQEAGGSRAAVEKALAILEDIAATANACARETVSAGELVVGLQCGGSDGFSGITANPALGIAVDMLVAAGGTAILSETPEIYGAEHLLTSRATPETGAKLMECIRWWENYAASNGASLDNNPSPGNKRGGLTTILEKSLGAVAKSGRSPLMDSIGYAERVATRGLVFMDTPGYDPVSATGQVAGGANVIVFTTGRGSCFGCKPAPSIKVASNSSLYRRMPDDMDLDAGRIVSGTTTLEQMGAEIYDMVLDVASGTKTASERFGYGDNEFLPWTIGAVL